MRSVRPYLIRALIDWIVDNDCTPYMVIDCGVPGVRAPAGAARDGKLVLNVSAAATRNLVVEDGAVSVDCRFQGASRHVSVPVGAVVAVYANENGMGMSFKAQTTAAEPVEEKPVGEEAPEPKAKRGAPKLTRVK